MEQSGIKIEHRWRENHEKNHRALKTERRKIADGRNEMGNNLDPVHYIRGT
jgi:hypothetical protein